MLSKRTSLVSPSATISINTKVKELKKEGKNVIGLSIGEPDFLTPEIVKNKGIEAIKNNKTKYDAAGGLLELKEEIIEKYKKEYNLNYTTDEIVISSGAKHSITNILLSIMNVNDDILIPKPYWTSYPEMVKILNGNPVFIDTKFENSFKVKPNELKNAITKNTKAIFITNPSNPTGAVYKREELEEIVEICKQNDIYIIADEIYEKIVFDGKLTSIAEFEKDKVIVVNGLSKSACMTGWRVGYTLSNKEIAKAMTKIQSHLVSHPSTISQYAAIKGINSIDEEINNMVNTYKKRATLIKEEINKINKLSLVEPKGAFYAFINISEIKDYIKYKDSFSIEVANILLDNYNIALVPGIAFGSDDFLRLSYASSIEDIKYAMNALKEFIKDITK